MACGGREKGKKKKKVSVLRSRFGKVILHLHLLLLLLSPEHKNREHPPPFFRGGWKGACGRKLGEVFLSAIPRMPLCPPFDRLGFFSFFFTTDVSSQASTSPLPPPPPSSPSFPLKCKLSRRCGIHYAPAVFVGLASWGNTARHTRTAPRPAVADG